MTKCTPNQLFKCLTHSVCFLHLSNCENLERILVKYLTHSVFLIQCSMNKCIPNRLSKLGNT